MSTLLFERVYYYWRQYMYGHVHVLCQQFIKTQGSDPQYLIWDALASGAEGKISQALTALDRLNAMLQSQLAVCYAKLWVNKQGKIPDYAAISALENEVYGLRQSASVSSIVQAAQILWLTGDNETAFSMLEPLTQQQPPSKEASCLVGWIKLTSGDRNSGRWFDMANQSEPSVMYGKALYFANVNKFQESLSCMVRLCGTSNFPEGNLERARINIAAGNWDLAIEASREGVGHYVSDIEVHLLTVLNELSTSGNLENARESTKKLCRLISKYEPENSKYITTVTKLILGLSWSDSKIVESLLTLYPRVLQANQEDANLLTMYGKLLVSSKKYSDAITNLQSAVVIDTSMEDAYAALVDAHISLNNIDDAQSQLMFLKTMSSSGSSELIVSTLQEKIARVTGTPTNVHELITAMHEHIDNVIQTFSAAASNDSSSEHNTLMVDRFFNVVLELRLPEFQAAMSEAMEHCNTLDRTVADPQNGPVCDVIEMMLEFIPGAVPFNYYLAVLGFGEGRYAQAVKAINIVLESHWGYNVSQCHLLLAQIKLQMQQFEEADAALNRAVGFDFGIRSSLRYNIILAQLEDARGQYDNAIKTAQAITKTQEFNTAAPAEKLNVILFLAKVYKRAGNLKEALKTVDDALAKFSGYAEESQIKLFKASLLAKSDRVQEGLAILDMFGEDDPIFVRARKTAAKIYLNILKDKASYIKCFKQLVQLSPNKTNYLMLGDAMMNVKRFNEAVEYFQCALDDDPEDGHVALHLARGFMIIHAFDRAIEAYENAIDLTDDHNAIVLELCKTEIKLRRYEEAREIAQNFTNEFDTERNDWEGQYFYAQFSELLSIIEMRLEDGSDDLVAQYISTAIEYLDRLTAPGRGDIPSDKLKEIKKKAAEMNHKNAESLLAVGHKAKAIEYLKKAAELDDTTTKSLILLANIYREDNKTNEASETCQQIIRIEPKCEEAAIILADISSNEIIAELQGIFTENPTFFRTLVRLIEVCARAGKLDTLDKYFEMCDKKLPGYIFCQGLYQYYIGNPQKAIENFYATRNDPDWGINAQVYSFNIKANPSRKFVWCVDKPLATQKDLQGAEKQLKRLKGIGLDTRDMEATLQLARNTPETVQKALEIYKAMKDDSPQVIVGMCRCFLSLKQQSNATRYLNSIINSDPKPNDIASYVEAYLMMTHISILDGSLDEAETYVNKAIALDKSCGKAWEMLGSIFEKKKMYEDAANAYNSAWKLTSCNDCYIGCKLAICYMKGKFPVEAIKVSRTILDKRPNYPKVKEQIMIPCCALIRQ